MAILPDGCLASDRDRGAWDFVRLHFTVDVLRDNDRSAFFGVRARTSVVRIVRTESRSDQDEMRSQQFTSDRSRLVRATYQMHNFRRNSESSLSYPLIHTTELREGKVQSTKKRVRHHSVVKGPALLIPRVGRVTSAKLAVFNSDLAIVLSDCVIAILCDSVTQAEDLRKQLVQSWANFASLYRGTGAPYVTVRSISKFVGKVVSDPVSSEKAVTGHATREYDTDSLEP